MTLFQYKQRSKIVMLSYINCLVIYGSFRTHSPDDVTRKLVYYDKQHLFDIKEGSVALNQRIEAWRSRPAPISQLDNLLIDSDRSGLNAIHKHFFVVHA